MIKKLFILLLLAGLFCYFVVAVTVFNRPSERLTCTSMEVVVEDSLETGFIRPSDVQRMLAAQKCNPVGKELDSVELSQVEKVLRKNPYIEDVTCYKTPGGKLCVHVKQRLPILHVMPANGDDYYLDRAGRQMPKSDYFAHLVVATGHISPKFARQNLLRLGRLIQDSPFWSSQVQQIHVTLSGEVELVPRVGEHIILLGPPTDVERKLNRMRAFYTEGLNKVGWNKYSEISLKYDNQIICKKK